MNQYAVVAMGDDRPGIVAAMTDGILAAGASIEDSSMTILGGQFAMLLLVQGELSRDDLEHALLPVAQELNLVLEVRAAESAAPRGGAEYVVAAYGPDRPGLVSALARELATLGVNITDFGSRLTEGGVFAMWFNVSLPPDCPPESVQQRLSEAGGRVSLDVSVHPADAEEL